MNKYLVTFRIRGHLVKTVMFADSATHARLICEYQFGLGCLNGSPTQIRSDGHEYPLLDDLPPTTTHTVKSYPPKPPKDATIKPIKPLAPKPPKTATIKPIKPIKPKTPDQMRVTQLKANVDRHKDALKRERENQKRQREAEHRWRNLGGI
jgi:hypothetical protein